MFTSNTAVRTLLLVVDILSTTAVAQAQASIKTALSRAIATHDSAVALYSQPNRAREAAMLHMREVHFRSAKDPEAVESLIMAANLYEYANDRWTARRVMEKAADRALSIGDIVLAAQAYTNAAFLAASNGKKTEVQRLARKAILLSESPLLGAKERASIRNRFRNDQRYASFLR